MPTPMQKLFTIFLMEASWSNFTILANSSYYNMPFTSQSRPCTACFHSKKKCTVAGPEGICTRCATLKKACSPYLGKARALRVVADEPRQGAAKGARATDRLVEAKVPLPDGTGILVRLAMVASECTCPLCGQVLKGSSAPENARKHLRRCAPRWDDESIRAQLQDHGSVEESPVQWQGSKFDPNAEHHLRVARSPSGGMGAFARMRIAKGRPMGLYAGKFTANRRTAARWVEWAKRDHRANYVIAHDDPYTAVDGWQGGDVSCRANVSVLLESFPLFNADSSSPHR